MPLIFHAYTSGKQTHRSIHPRASTDHHYPSPFPFPSPIPRLPFSLLSRIPKEEKGNIRAKIRGTSLWASILLAISRVVFPLPTLQLSTLNPQLIMIEASGENRNDLPGASWSFLELPWSRVTSSVGCLLPRAPRGYSGELRRTPVYLLAMC